MENCSWPPYFLIQFSVICIQLFTDFTEHPTFFTPSLHFFLSLSLPHPSSFPFSKFQRIRSCSQVVSFPSLPQPPPSFFIFYSCFSDEIASLIRLRLQVKYPLLFPELTLGLLSLTSQLFPYFSLLIIFMCLVTFPDCSLLKN